MDQLALQIAIAFFGVQVVAWAGLGLYIRATHRRRAEEVVVDALAELQPEPVAQAA